MMCSFYLKGPATSCGGVPSDSLLGRRWTSAGVSRTQKSSPSYASMMPSRKVFPSLHYFQQLEGDCSDPASARSSVHPARTAGSARQNFPAGSLLRSEEHTSELQSLMRISYAVF